MENAYRGCAINVDHFDTYDHFIKCVRNLEFSSSPGFPFSQENPTIGEWLGFDGVDFSMQRLMRLWHMVVDLFEEEEIDCLWRVFIKSEPHKLHKMKSKRYRLIMCPPLHVQVLWQMLFMEQNAKEVINAYSIPSQQGIVLPYGGWRQYYDQWCKQGTVCGTDAVAWDWTLPGWVFKLDLEFRKCQVRGSRVNQWAQVAAKLYRNAFRDTKILISDGRVFQQQHWGVMKSGCVNTISTNSHGGFMFHCLYCYDTETEIYPYPKCVGDDQLQHEKHLSNLAVYSKYGKIIKSVSSTCEFVGRQFSQQGPKPMYINKHLFNIYYCDDLLLEQTLNSYLMENALCDEGWGVWSELIQLLGLAGEFPSRRTYKRWYDHPDGAKMLVNQS